MNSPPGRRAGLVSSRLRGGGERIPTDDPARQSRDCNVLPLSSAPPTEGYREQRNVLGLHQRQAAARTTGELDVHARQIAATGREIEALVYEFNGLTEGEIALMKGAGGQQR